jgi:hypothetical protein
LLFQGVNTSAVWPFAEVRREVLGFAFAVAVAMIISPSFTVAE